MVNPEREAMAIFLADLDHLDGEFERLRTTRELRLPVRPSRYTPGDDVLLAGAGPAGSGDLYVFVGIVRGVEFSGDEEWLVFKQVHRFWRVVVGVYGNANHHRTDLMGIKQGWGPSNLYYLPYEALSAVPEEAERSLSR